MGNGFSHLYGHIALALALLATCLLSLSGLLRQPDLFLYDQVVGRLPAGASRANVLLVECPTEARTLSDEQWRPLLESLDRLGARRVAFTFVPEGAHLGEKLWADRLFGIVPGAAMPAGVDPARLGMVALPPSHHGLSLAQPVAAQGSPTLVALAAATAPEQPFWINFNQGVDRLPRVTLERAQRQGLVGDLARDRVVLIGIVDPGYGPFVHVPGQAAKERVTLLHYQGLAVDTLLGPGPVVPAGTVARLLCILLVAGFGLFAYQGLPLRFATPLTLIMLAGYIGLGWGSLLAFRYWPPVIEAMLTQVLMFLLLFTRKSEREAQALQDALLSTSVKLQERIFPASVLNSQDYWAQVAVMVNQILDLNRLIFLERVPGDHRVREVKAIHCSLQDIREKRRDYHRHPYSTAIDRGGPLQLPQDYLAPGEQEEQQYLVPLTFTGEVHGFWAFGVDPGKKKGLPLFDEVVKSFGEQIGELLFQRQQWLARKAREENLLIRYLRLEGGDQGYRSLNTAVALLEKRLGRLENLFHGLDTATILYDLFGRVVLVNQEMTRLMEKAELAPFAMTALDFTVAVTGVERVKARRILEKIILERDDVALPALLRGHPGRRFLFKIRPLRIEEKHHEGENYPFSLQGILSELVDVTDLDKTWAIKRAVYGTVHAAIDGHLDAIDGHARQLDGMASDPVRLAEAGRLIGRETGAAREALGRVHELMLAVDDDELAKHLPVDPAQVLRSAAAKLREAAEERRVGFRFELGETVKPLLVAEEELQDVLVGILAFLLRDAVEGSEIRVVAESLNQSLSLEFVNSGFGIPDPLLQSCLRGDELLHEPEFKNLRRSARLVHHWGGMLEGRSVVGEGTRLTLRMQGGS